MGTNIGLVPAIQDLQGKIQQAEAMVTKTVDSINGIMGPNGAKIPSTSSLKKLLGSLPSAISTIQTVVQSFSNLGAPNLSQINGLGGYLNSAIGTAQSVVGAIQSVVGAASALGINVEALGGLSREIAGVSTRLSSAPTNGFNTTPQFLWEIATDSPGKSFPLDLNDSFEKIQLSFADYKKTEVTQPASYVPTNSIYLPLPRDLNESYALDWSEFSPGPIRSLVADLNKAVSEGEQTISGAISSTGDFVGAIPEKFSAYFDKLPTAEKTAALVGLGQLGLYYTSGPRSAEYGVISNFTGLAVNPYTTVAFNGPYLRSHNFAWILAPKSQKESERLLEILNMLRKAALPKSQQGMFLEYPSVVNVKFHPEEKNLYNFKRCVIKGLTINHAGSGQPSFFAENQLPTVYIVQLSLQETEIYTNEDVGIPSDDTSNLRGPLGDHNFLNPGQQSSDDEEKTMPGK